MGESDEFNTLNFEKRLSQLKDTQESIQSLSSWCLKQRPNHKKIVSSWLNVLKRVKVEQRLTLFYLANDVIQYSKRKNYEFVGSWGCYLQKATPLVRDEKVRSKILRIFKIWEERSVYDDEFLSDLTGLLSMGATKKSADEDPLDFQPTQLINKIRQCTSLESDTDQCLKYIHESDLELSDSDLLCASLKDRRHTGDVEKELNEGIVCVEKYTQALQKEIVARETLLDLLNSATQYYAMQRGEVKVVALAYKSFGQRVRILKRKLDELIPTLPNAIPSPPQRDEDVPSPGPDEDLELPTAGDNDEEVSYNIDKTFSTSLSADGSLYNLGLSSFLSGDTTLNLFGNDLVNSKDMEDNSAKKIEVVNSSANKQPEINIKDILKNILPVDGNTSDNNSVGSGTVSQKSQEAVPGLDLLSNEIIAPPTNFYGALQTNVPENPEPYTNHTPLNVNQWNENTPWTTSSAVPTMVPPVTSSMHLAPPPIFSEMSKLFPETPESPPPPPPPPLSATPLQAPPVLPNSRIYSQELSSADVDHRGLIPPPPPPPILPMQHLEDVDQRLLPTLLPPAPVLGNRHNNSAKDVDHRNLISLTHQASPGGEPSRGIDQDYRGPPPMPPPDIVESVDMDLSEDEEQLQHMIYQNPNNNFKQDDISRRISFNQNNKVLVGGNVTKNDNQRNTNLITLNNRTNDSNMDKAMPPAIPEALTAPPPLPLLDPFEIVSEQLKSPPVFKQQFSQPSTPLPVNSPYPINPSTPVSSNSPFPQTPSTPVSTNPPFHSNPGTPIYSQTPFPQNQSTPSSHFAQQPSTPLYPPPQQVQRNPQFHHTNPPNLQSYPPPNTPPVSNSMQSKETYEDTDFESIEEAMRLMDEGNSNDSAFDDGVRTRFFDLSGNIGNREIVRNPSPPQGNGHFVEDQWAQKEDWANPQAPVQPRPYMNPINPRFQRSWNPVMRPNLRPPNFMHQLQFRPRHAPRTPNRPWLGRPPRFW